MSQLLSSRWTPFYKFVMPALMVGGMGVGAWMTYAHPDTVHGVEGFSRDYAWVLLAIAAVFAGGITWWVGARMVRVELDGDELIISNYRAEARVPLSNIESISERSVTNPKRYTITFVETTEFGRSVVLLPPMDWSLMGFGEAAAVSALRVAWEEVKGAQVRRR